MHVYFRLCQKKLPGLKINLMGDRRRKISVCKYGVFTDRQDVKIIIKIISLLCDFITFDS